MLILDILGSVSFTILQLLFVVDGAKLVFRGQLALSLNSTVFLRLSSQLRIKIL